MPETIAGMVRKERLELSRVAPLEPKSSASTSSATLAMNTPAPSHGNRARRRPGRNANDEAWGEREKMVGRLGFEPRTN